MKESLINQVKSFILPFTVLLIIPAGILLATGFRIGWGLGWPWDAVVVLAGSVLMGNGLYYLFMTIWLFINIGKGTLAPWSPTKRLVIIGPYRHVRNPMISSVHDDPAGRIDRLRFHLDLFMVPVIFRHQPHLFRVFRGTRAGEEVRRGIYYL